MKRIENTVYIPVSVFIKVTKVDGEAGERAMLVARDENGKESTFMYDDFNDEPQDLTVYNLPDKKQQTP